MPEQLTKINFGIKPKREKHYHNDSIEVKGIWGNADFHEKALNAIYDKYPEASIHGYALVQDEPKEPTISKFLDEVFGK